MTNPATPSPQLSVSFFSIPRHILANRWLRALFVVFAALEVFNLALAAAYISTQQAREETAKADNAALLQGAQADITKHQSLTQTEVAANAKRKHAADAKRSTAEARKAEAEEEIADEVARNSAIKAKAEADLQSVQAEINAQLLKVETELAHQAERLKAAEAINAQLAAADAKIPAIVNSHDICLSCSMNRPLPKARSVIPKPPAPPATKFNLGWLE